jgi:predicted molibdopterin-dependent oxidoreductase YjgC
MKTVDTICGECSLGCNVQAWKKGTDLLRLTPRIAPEVNEWWLCDRGRFGIHRIPDGERLRTPVKTGAPTELSTPEEIARGLAEGIRHLPKQSFAVVVNSPLVNEEFYVLKELAKAAGGGRLFVPIRRETRDLCGVIRKSGLEAGSLSSLERADSILVVGGNVEEDHPVLALRLRRLVRERGIPVHFVGGGDPSEFFPALHSLAGQRVHLLLSDRVVTRERSEAIRKGIDLLSRQKEKRVDISMLLTGEGNIRGVIDQWDETVFPMSELETEIQRGKIEGLYWFGPALSFPDFNEYVRGMRFFAQVVPSAKDAHPSAKRVLPADLFTEKRGTATENFGRVQLVRSARRVVERGFAPLDFVGSILSQLGGEIPSDVTRLYAEMASALPGYPPDLAAIPDAARTYRFYERALWR